MLFVARQMGAPPTLLPLGEPATSMIFGLVGSAFVIMSARRRALILRFLERCSERDALLRWSSSTATISRQLDVCSDRIEELLGELPKEAAEGTIARSMRAAVSKLGAANERIAALRPSTEVGEISPTGGASGRGAIAREEAQLLARDAHESAMISAALCVVSGSIVALDARTSLPSGAVAWASVALISLLLLVLLGTRRGRCSTRLPTLAVLLLCTGIFVADLVVTRAWLRESHSAFVPGTGHNILLAALPLVLVRPRWLLFLLQAAVLVGVFATYEVLDLAAFRDRMSFLNPWDSLLYAAIGLQLFTQIEHRGITSLRLLRTELELRAMTRRMILLSALKDRINSPLQVLTIGIEALTYRGLVDEERAAVAGRELKELPRQWPAADELVRSDANPLSFDADKALGPRE